MSGDLNLLHPVKDIKRAYRFLLPTLSLLKACVDLGISTPSMKANIAAHPQWLLLLFTDM